MPFKLNPLSGQLDIVNIAGGSITIPATHTLYVDGNRTDSYTEDGTILYPYKTVQPAIDASITGQWYAFDTVHIASGIYLENIVMSQNCVALVGDHPEATIIVSNTGNTVTIPAGYLADFFSLQVKSNSANPADSAIYSQGSGYCQQAIIQGTAGCAFLCDGGGLISQLTMYGSTGNSALRAINGGYLDTLSDYYWGNPDVSTDSSSYFYVSGGSDFASLLFYGTPLDLQGSTYLYSPAMFVSNDSTVVGASVKDALNTLDSGKLSINGINGSFTTVDGKTVTVVNGQIISIV